MIVVFPSIGLGLLVDASHDPFGWVRKPMTFHKCDILVYSDTWQNRLRHAYTSPKRDDQVKTDSTSLKESMVTTLAQINKA